MSGFSEMLMAALAASTSMTVMPSQQPVETPMASFAKDRATAPHIASAPEGMSPPAEGMGLTDITAAPGNPDSDFGQKPASRASARQGVPLTDAQPAVGIGGHQTNPISTAGINVAQGEISRIAVEPAVPGGANPRHHPNHHRHGVPSAETGRSDISVLRSTDGTAALLPTGGDDRTFAHPAPVSPAGRQPLIATDQHLTQSIEASKVTAAAAKPLSTVGMRNDAPTSRFLSVSEMDGTAGPSVRTERPSVATPTASSAIEADAAVQSMMRSASLEKPAGQPSTQLEQPASQPAREALARLDEAGLPKETRALPASPRADSLPNPAASTAPHRQQPVAPDPMHSPSVLERHEVLSAQTPVARADREVAFERSSAVRPDRHAATASDIGASQGTMAQTKTVAPSMIVDAGIQRIPEFTGFERVQPVLPADGPVLDADGLGSAATPGASRAQTAPGSVPAGAQIAVQIVRSLPSGVDRFSVHLQPAELGSVDIQLNFESSGRLSALITAERAETLELLQRDSRLLERSLGDSGLKLGSDGLSFALKQDHQQQQHGQGFHDQAQARQRAAARAERAYDGASETDQVIAPVRVDRLRLLDIET